MLKSNLNSKKKKELFKKVKICYFTDSILAPIFQIHSYPLLNELKHYYDITIISIEEKLTIRNNYNQFIQQKKNIEKDYQLKIIIYRSPFFLPKILKQLIIILPKLFVLTKINNFKYFHARGYLPAILLNYLKKINDIKFVFDMRGAFVDEMKLINQLSEDNLKVKLWRMFERKTINNSDQIVVVSEQFNNYIESKYRAHKINVIKNSIIKEKLSINDYNKIRIQFRDELNIQDKLVWIYSGSNFNWQLIDRAIELFAFATQKRSDLFFLFLTRDDVTEITSKFVKCSISNDKYKILTVESKHVRNYLIASDLGILLRENNIINNVSHPLKYVEYLKAGLPVLISKNIGDTQDIVMNNKLGVVLNSNSKNEFIKRFDEIINIIVNRNPQHILDVANKEYNFERCVLNYKEVYKNLVMNNEN